MRGFRPLYRIALALSCLAVFCPAGHAGPEGALLAYAFQKGQKASYVSEATQEIATSISGKSTIDTTVDFTTEVLSVDPTGVARIQLTVTRVVFSMKSPFLNSSYDSSSPAPPKADPLSQTWAGLVNKPLVAKVTPRGEVVELEGIEKIVENLRAAGGLDQQMMQVLPQNLCVFPDHPVTVGQTWTAERSGTIPILNQYIKTQSLFRLAGRKAGVLTIAMDGFTAEINEAQANASPVLAMKMSLSQSSGKGTLVINPANGLLDSAAIETNLTLDLNSQAEGGLQITSQAKSTMVIKRAAVE